MTMLFEERYGSSAIRRSYASDGRSISVIAAGNDQLSSGEGTLLERVSNLCRSVFLPQGFPESVSSDYVPYQVFDTIQAFASSITGTLATQALMKGVGVGDEEATALAATLTWILKDGTGMVGRIVFAWMKGSGLDCDAKRWRLFADMLNDAAICVEIAAPYIPRWLFTPVVCAAGVGKSIVGVAGGATRSALTQHQARRNNMADVSAKDGSQETLVNLAALLCSLVMVPIVNEKPLLIWFLFTIFTCVHIFANYRAVKSVVMESINLARLHIIVGDWLMMRQAVPSDVNKREPVFRSTQWPLGEPRFGETFSPVARLLDVASISRCVREYASEKYLLVPNLETKGIYVILNREAEVSDLLKAGFQAELMQWARKLEKEAGFEVMQDGSMLREALAAVRSGDTEKLIAVTHDFANREFDGFMNMLKANGWTTSHVLFGADEWRVGWDKSL